MFKYVCVSLKCMCASLISGSLILCVGRRSSMKNMDALWHGLGPQIEGTIV